MAYDQNSQYQPPQRDYYGQKAPPGPAYSDGGGQGGGYGAAPRKPLPQPRNNYGQEDYYGGGGAGGGYGVGYADGGREDQPGYANGNSRPGTSNQSSHAAPARVGWDNSYPTFEPKPKRSQDGGGGGNPAKDLDNSMGRLNIAGNGYGASGHSDRPAGTSRSNSNHSARGYNNQPSPGYGQAYSNESQNSQYPPRNNGLYAERFQEPVTAPVSPAARSFQEEPQRSMTMPSNVTGYDGQSGPSRGGVGGGYNPQDSYGRSHSDQNGQPYGYGGANGAYDQNHDAGYDVLDSYYGGGSNRPSPGEEMPDFDLQNRKQAAHGRRMSQDRGAPPAPAHGGYGGADYYGGQAGRGDFGAQAHRSRSQPDLRRQNSREGAGGGAVEMPAGDVPPMPPAHRDRGPPGADPYGRGQPNRRMPGSGRGGYGGPPPRGRGFNGPPPRGGPSMRGGPGPGPNGRGRPYPAGGAPRGGPPGPYRGRGDRGGYPGGPAGRGPDPRDPNGRRPPTREGSSAGNANPDALPSHPAPVRAGLMKDSPVNNGPPDNQRPPNSRGSTGSQSSQSNRLSAPPVTLAELDRLNQSIRTNPGDRKTQLTLAKKWVEAATTLADDNGRADPRTTQRNRDKYYFDALKLTKKLVASGYPAAMFFLADAYGQGGVMNLPVDHREAFKLYQSAAKAGHSASAYRTAVCYEMGAEDGGGTTRDPNKAIEWYRRAAAMGDTPAMYKMGMIQLKGLLSQPRNPREAVTWLKRAAEKADAENPHALHELGLLYLNASPQDHIIRDEAYARQLFFEAAELGYKFSEYRLGAAHEFGNLGCPIDPRTSIAWYSRAAVQEEHQSELALSGWYLTGAEGVVTQSDTEAYLWARKAAQSGLAKAEFAMGYFTEVGIGCPSNLEEAKRWYQRAAGQNFTKARERLDELRKGGAKMQKSRERLSRSKHTENDCKVM